MRADRIVGGVALVVAALVVVTVAATAAPVLPPAPSEAIPAGGRGPVDDPATVARFLELYDRAAGGSWRLDAEFVRSRGETTGLVSSWTELQDGAGSQLIAAFGGLTGTYAGRTIECGSLADGSVCQVGPAPDPEAVLAANRAATAALVEIDTGAYTVVGAPGRVVAGYESECFVLELRAGAESDAFGARAHYCFAQVEDAVVPALVVQERAGVQDARTAVSMGTHVTDDDLRMLLGPRADLVAGTDVASEP